MTRTSTSPSVSSRCSLALVLLLAACSGGRRGPVPKAAPPTGADLVLLNGTIHTMNVLGPLASGLAIEGGHVVAVGEARDMQQYIGDGTRVIDLGGRSAVAGLVDGHAHLRSLGQTLEMIDLRGVATPEEVAAKVAEVAKSRAPGDWIFGRGWDQNLFPGKQFPTYHVLSEVAPAQNVALERVDGHALWVNRRALRIANITRETKDPPGGRIERDAKGEPTGVLVDAAMDLVSRQIPADGPEAIERQILAGQRAALAVGLTGVHEMGMTLETAAIYRKLAASKQLRIRIYAYLSGDEGRERIAASGLAPGPRAPADRFVVRGIKLFADGALGSRGAALLGPYSDDPKSSGHLVTPEAELATWGRWAVDNGWQLAVHAIGDAANRLVLDMYASSLAGMDAAQHRMRIEHAQILSPDDLPRFGKLGVIASMQPTHATSDMPWAEARVGAERLPGAYAWKTLLASGARVVGGSDFPVEEPAPLLGIYAAVTRQDRVGQPEGGWLPGQKLDLQQALRLFTLEPAYAAFAEEESGKLVPGHIGDVTVFDRNLVEGAPLLETRVDLTIIAGKIEYERESP